MSSADERVANYIVSTDFCPVLATGLSALYSSLPRQIDVKTEEWHFLRKEDWSRVPALVNFMNSFEFCNSVIEAAESIVGETLLKYIYHGFLVSVFGPALHKPSASEVIVTTAYLNLFLQSVTAPSLLRCFLRFLLCHRHDNSLIINTLIQRIGSSSKLASVSMSLFQTLLDLNCEDLMLHLVFRYLIPCQHILSSQHRSICDVDMYSASAHRFINLSPKCYGAQCGDEIVDKENIPVEDLSDGNEMAVSEKSVNTKERAGSKTSSGSNTSSNPGDPSTVITSPTTMAEFGPDHESQMSLRTSYMDYLENANAAILSCKEACEYWSELYDGTNPPTDAVTEINVGAVSSAGLSRTAISLMSIQNECDLVSKTHAQSDPTPMHYQKFGDNSHNPALHALNATYQAINATANALNKSAVFIPSKETTPKHEIQASDGVTDEVITTQINSEPECAVDEVSVPTSPIGDSQNPSHENDRDDFDGTKIDETIETDKDKLPSLQTSSVDEFFRKLMESVPMKARQNAEGPVNIDEKTDEIEPINNEEESEGFHDGAVSTNSEEGSSSMSQNDDEDADNCLDDALSINSSFYETDLEYAPAEFSTPSVIPPLKMHATPYTGPFLSTLFGKVDQMPNNSLYENLLLTGIISRLSCYPQPLLRSFLLNTHVVFHPSVRSLYQVLSGVRNRIDSYSKTVDDFTGLLCRAEKYLLARDSESTDSLVETSLVKEMPMPVPRVKTRNTVLGEVFLRRKQRKARIGKLEALAEDKNAQLKSASEGLSMFYTSSNAKNLTNKQMSDSQTKNVVFACIVLHEFLKELAAVSQEHAVTCNWL